MQLESQTSESWYVVIETVIVEFRWHSNESDKSRASTTPTSGPASSRSPTRDAMNGATYAFVVEYFATNRGVSEEKQGKLNPDAAEFVPGSGLLVGSENQRSSDDKGAEDSEHAKADDNIDFPASFWDPLPNTGATWSQEKEGEDIVKGRGGIDKHDEDDCRIGPIFIDWFDFGEEGLKQVEDGEKEVVDGTLTGSSEPSRPTVPSATETTTKKTTKTVSKTEYPPEKRKMDEDDQSTGPSEWHTVGRKPSTPPPTEFPPLPAPANPPKREPPTAAHFTTISKVGAKAGGTAVLPAGILHLFRTTPASFPPEPEALPPSEPCLALLAIPSYVAAADLLALLPPSRSVAHIRLIRDGSGYACVIRFRSESGADDFARRCHGKKWTGGGAWSVVRVEGVVFAERGSAVEPAERLFREGVELPTCPVCLDRLDPPASGLLTTLCLHTFHPPCLASCPPRCPVCRHPTNPTPNQSCSCGAERDLWICLICGHVGCGRYVRGCARDHFGSTGHRFALEIGEGRVWDYRGDGYVHRLVRDKDGGAIPLPSPSDPLLELSLERAAASGSHDDMVPREKVDALGLEWGHMVARELDSQRAYFEGRILEVEERWENVLEELRTELEEAEAQRKVAMTELQATKTALESSEKERVALRKLLEKSAERMRDASKQLDEEKAMSASLLAAASQLRSEAATRDVEIAELKETVRDLMVALEVGKKIGEEPELQGGGVEVATPSPRGKGRKKK